MEPSLFTLPNLTSSSSSSSFLRLGSYVSFHVSPPPLLSTNRRHYSSFRIKMSTSNYPPPLPDNRTVLGFGMVALDFLAEVEAFPKPDDKIRSTSFMVQGGGNCGNALTCAARLGLQPRLISKIANDSQGRGILEELEADGVDTSFIVVSKEGNSPFSYLIVDNKMKTRACIHTRGDPPMIPDNLPQSTLLSALEGARVVYFDGVFDTRFQKAALVIAQEATRKNLPILVEAEKMREELGDLLDFASYVVCSAEVPLVWTEAPSIPSALVSILLRLPKLKFVIVTLGENGCIMLERSTNEAPALEESDVDSLVESLKQRKDETVVIPTCFASSLTKLRANGIGTVNGRIFVGTAEKIPPAEIIDTTGAGDAFIGAVLYGLCMNMPPEQMLPFAAQVAAACCRALGARTGLPHGTDPRLAPFLH